MRVRIVDTWNRFVIQDRMPDLHPILEPWSEIVDRLPAFFDLSAMARQTGALRRVREVKSASDLLRLALAYVCGFSLEQTCMWAEAAGIVGRLTKQSLTERLRNAEAWLGQLVQAILTARIANARVPLDGGRRLRAVDATALCCPGADRTTWRLHVSYDLLKMQVGQIELTDDRGAESLRRFTYEPGDIVLADRGYARPRDLRPVVQAGADFIVRTGWNSLRLLTGNGEVFELFGLLRAMAGGYGQAAVWVDEGQEGNPFPVRLVMFRKSPEQAAKAKLDVQKAAKKRGKEPDPRSLEASEYILLLTSLDAAKYSAYMVADLYRFRWQIELSFKRWKSLGGLDALPAKGKLARSWIFAKLILCLLAEDLTGPVPDSPPSGLSIARTTRSVDPAPRITEAWRADGTVAVADHQSRPRSHSRHRPRAAPRRNDPEPTPPIRTQPTGEAA